MAKHSSYIFPSLGNASRKYAGLHIVFCLVAATVLSSCTIAGMEVVSPGSKTSGLNNSVTSITQNFVAGPDQRQVDILFVDDNSASMDPSQGELGSKFATLATALSGLDWQAGIVTTDCSTDAWGNCGSLVTFSGTTQTVLTPSMTNYAQVFNSTIVRPETVGCIGRGVCPTSDSQPLLATMTAIDKRNSANVGFFRAHSALAVVILTDENEDHTGPVSATQPQALVDHFNSIWGGTKTIKGFAIDVMPSDGTCLNQFETEYQVVPNYGTFESQFASLTGGLSQSICSADYGPLLQQIAGSLQGLTNLITLSHTPLANSVMVTLTPAQPGVTWTVQGNDVVFSVGLPAGTQISVSYNY